MINISQNHTGSGDCIGGNKIINQEMLNGATIKGSKIGSFTQSTSMGTGEDLIISDSVSWQNMGTEVKICLPLDEETLNNFGIVRKDGELTIEFYDKDSVVFGVKLTSSQSVK